MSALDIEELSVTEKFQLLEAIWDDFRDKYENSPVPQEHKDILDARRSRFERGETKILDWDSVKSTIGRG